MLIFESIVTIPQQRGVLKNPRPVIARNPDSDRSRDDAAISDFPIGTYHDDYPTLRLPRSLWSLAMTAI